MKDGCGRNLPAIVAGRADEDCIVIQSGRKLCQLEGRTNTLAPHAGDEDFFRRGGFGGDAEYVACFRVVERDGFARRAKNHHTRQQTARVARHVGFDFPEVNVLVRHKTAW